MLQMLRKRANEDKGFTLIELLVVVLIIGILAAIALPTFLGQREKAQDASAKSNARNAVSQMESCFTDAQTYVGCDLSSTPSGLPVGTGPGQVAASSQTVSSYVVTAKSQSGGNFLITHAASGVSTRTCNGGTKGCNAGSW